MKSLLNLKNTFIALTAAVVVGNLLSCQDNHFDWDEKHATTSQEKFTNVFIEEFGKPAAGHTWGFDLEWEKQTRAAITRANPSADEDGYLPVDANGNYAYINKVESEYFPNILHYGTVPNITAKEHWEVYEWFLTHKVTWENTTTADNGVFYNGTSTKNQNGIVAEKTAELSSNNSLLTNMTGDLAYWLGDPNVGLNIDFRHAWIQQVANDRDNDFASTPGAHLTSAQQAERMEVAFNGTSTYNSSNMNYLEFYSTDGSVKLSGSSSGAGGHTLDFNAGKGYGWGNQKDHSVDYKVNNVQLGGTYKFNGELLCGVDFDQTTYQCSAGSSLSHDKWIIVYLKGDDYEGWYLGMDFESAGSNSNEKVPANGYCNNWIIKLSSVDRSTGNSHQVRLMCEDLGAVEGKNGSDIDYNDIVLDVDYRLYAGVTAPTGSTASGHIPTKGDLYLTPVAAGGTLPLVVAYNSTPLFEVHEFMLEDKTFQDADHVMDLDNYKLMLNTNAPQETSNGVALNGRDDVATPTYTVRFASPTLSNTSKKIHYTADFAPTTWQDLVQKLQLNVYRFSAVEYVNNPNSVSSPAEWLMLENETNGAPVKLCVPQTLNWLKERHKISNGYSGFSSWVADTDEIFWSNTSLGTVTASELYKGLSTAPAYTINPESPEVEDTPTTPTEKTVNNTTVSGTNSAHVQATNQWSQYSLTSYLDNGGRMAIDKFDSYSIKVSNLNGANLQIKINGATTVGGDESDHSDAAYIPITQNGLQTGSFAALAASKGWVEITTFALQWAGTTTQSVKIEEVIFTKETATAITNEKQAIGTTGWGVSNYQAPAEVEVFSGSLSASGVSEVIYNDNLKDVVEGSTIYIYGTFVNNWLNVVLNEYSGSDYNDADSRKKVLSSAQAQYLQNNGKIQFQGESGSVITRIVVKK